MSEDNSKKQESEKHKETENLDKSFSDIKKQKRSIKESLNSYKKNEIFVILIILIGMIILPSIIGIFYNCCKKPSANKDLKEALVVVQTEIIEIQEKIKEFQKNFQDSNQKIIKSKQSNQCMDSVTADFSFKTKAGDSSFNLSVQGQQNSNNRSDCFWFIIFCIIALLLILLFYLIAFSSRESKLLQFITDKAEQKKEIELKKLEYEKKALKEQKEGNSSG